MKILLVVYDNKSYVHVFPMSMAAIASPLRTAGHEVEVYLQDVNRWPDEHLTEHLNNNKYDAIGISIIGGYYQYAKLLTLSKAINASKNRPYFILGGHGPSPEPKYFMKKTGADAVVIGEGEETIVELLNNLQENKPLDDVKGIAFRKGEDEYQVNPRRPLIMDLDTIPWPAYDMFPMEYYRLLRVSHCRPTDHVIPILSGRGCKFVCTFCYRLDKGLRVRSHESIIEEMRMLKKDYGINYVAFYDELLMTSVERIESLCEALIKADTGMSWNCNGRLNFAKLDVLKLMERAGCRHINYGIESVDQQVLKNMRKALTPKIIHEGIANTRQTSMTCTLNMLFGNIGDNWDTLKSSVEFMKEHDDCHKVRTIRPVTPYPGSPLYFDALKKGLIKDVEDFYENKHVNSDLLAANFTEMSDDEVYDALTWANTELVQNYYKVKCNESLDQVRHLYGERDASFRGFRQV